MTFLHVFYFELGIIFKYFYLYKPNALVKVYIFFH